jgi:hypothetical protein
VYDSKLESLMKKEEIYLTDIKRILFGQAPGEFLIEVLIRTLIIYVLLLLVLKLMGKRMDGQISIIEMGVMIVLGAILGVATQIPDRGILMAAAALLCVLVFQRGINWLNVKSSKIENVTNGSLNILVKDGVLQLDEMTCLSCDIAYDCMQFDIHHFHCLLHTQDETIAI